MTQETDTWRANYRKNNRVVSRQRENFPPKTPPKSRQPKTDGCADGSAKKLMGARMGPKKFLYGCADGSDMAGKIGQTFFWVLVNPTPPYTTLHPFKS